MEASPRRSSSTPLYTAPLPSVHLSPVHAKANHPMKLRHENGTMIRKIQGWAKLSISSAGTAVPDEALAGSRPPKRPHRDRQEDEAPTLQPVDVERVRTIEKVAAAKIYLESY
uniref:Uncharacterized protein n=1 Tax=Colletotrichum fructicola (strain Nara gc5) TaxID=1213859 RepID=L2G2J9_COLFN